MLDYSCSFVKYTYNLMPNRLLVNVRLRFVILVTDTRRVKRCVW